MKIKKYYEKNEEYKRKSNAILLNRVSDFIEKLKFT
jgi:hypothetical protein